MSKLELHVYWAGNPYEREQVEDLIGTRCLYGRSRRMKKLNKFDFLAINKRMNGGEKPFIGKTKKITKV